MAPTETPATFPGPKSTGSKRGKCGASGSSVRVWAVIKPTPAAAPTQPRQPAPSAGPTRASQAAARPARDAVGQVPHGTGRVRQPRLPLPPLQRRPPGGDGPVLRGAQGNQAVQGRLIGLSLLVRLRQPADECRRPFKRTCWSRGGEEALGQLGRAGLTPGRGADPVARPGFPAAVSASLLRFLPRRPPFTTPGGRSANPHRCPGTAGGLSLAEATTRVVHNESGAPAGDASR